MSYTNKESVEKYIGTGAFPGGFKRDYPVVFSGLDEIILPGHGIVEGTVVVKALANAAPAYEEIVLENQAKTLEHELLVPNSVTVASDSSLGTIYSENIDYSVDYTNGKVTRIDDGNILSGDTVSVWYFYYSKYVEGVDFVVNHQTGTVRFLSGGAIQSGQTVLIDYQLNQSLINENAINEIVNQANAIVENEIDKDRTFGADPVLQAAATCLAVSLLCRIEGAGSLRYNSTGSNDAKSWLSLADSYRADYENIIKKYRPGAARLNRPTYS